MSSFRSKLDRLVPPTITPSAKHQGVRQDVLHHIDLGRLLPSPDNPRSSYPEEQIQGLADSLTELGQMQPIICYWSGVEQKYVILAGHRRYYAAKRAGLRELAAVVVQEDIDRIQQLAKRMAENTARSDLHPLDMAKAIRQMMDERQLTQQQVARMLGRSQAWVSGQLALLSLPEDDKAKLSTGSMRMTQARAAVVKRPRRRRGPKQIKLVIGGLSAVITFRRVQDECAAAEALERLRPVADQLDAEQARDAA